MKLTGRCLCEAVTFTAEGVEPDVHACHCGMCRRWAGGPVLGVSVQSIKFTGEENIATFPSSDWAERGFCKTCGTNLFYRLKQPSHYIICFGAFDDPTKLALSGEIYIDDKPDSYAFAGDHQRMTEKEFMASIGLPPHPGA